MSGRRLRTDSIAGKMRAISQAAATIELPSHIRLREIDQPFWDSIVRSRAASEWVETDIAHAALLAWTLAEIEALRAALDGEPYSVFDQKGKEIINPKHALLDQMSQRAGRLSKLLQLDALARNGRPEEVAKEREAVAEARGEREHMDAIDPMSLLARRH